MTLNRRAFVRGSAVAAGLAATAEAAVPRSSTDAQSSGPSFKYCLNTSTISGQKLPIEQTIDLAATVGYQALEPWIRELDEYKAKGRSLEDLGKRIKDSGITVESSIGFFDWCVDDEGRRKKALEEAKRNLDMVARIGGKRLAAPPAGATDVRAVDLRPIAERYRALLELGDQFGVVPQVELWGFSKTLSRLSDAAFVAIESGHPSACILADVFHMYKGGSDVDGLRLLSGEAMHVIHFNDYPAEPPREKIDDSYRVFPGDGVAPLSTILKLLASSGFSGFLSLELFNRAYWKEEASDVARKGLEKMKAVVASTFAKAK